jgi:hypothetical protein
MSDPTGSAGRGRLAEVLATRGGRAEPKAPFVIEHREALIYMLCQAAELEHGIMRQYLFAAFSLKQRTSNRVANASRSLGPTTSVSVRRSGPSRRTSPHTPSGRLIGFCITPGRARVRAAAGASDRSSS